MRITEEEWDFILARRSAGTVSWSGKHFLDDGTVEVYGGCGDFSVVLCKVPSSNFWYVNIFHLDKELVDTMASNEPSQTLDDAEMYAETYVCGFLNQLNTLPN